ncbi:phenylacetate--CoA ligase family protein [Alkalimonas sp. NCh-2]|uniref:phenylacetate--CoA ligase family protein n=1 Tax=Alkalimonas sp. NCh-2 TaxID=3144846 RepID=UPI0031F621CA
MLYFSFLSKHLYPLYESLRGRKTHLYYREYLANQHKTPDEIAAIQLQKLKALLHHCQLHVPYYQKSWRELGFDPASVQSVADLNQLPLLTKSLVRQHYDELIASNFRGKNITKTTGGSTGEPFRFEHDRENYDRRQGVAWRGYGWAGYELGDKSLYYWGGAIGRVAKKAALKDKLYNMMLGRNVLNVFYMDKDNIHRFVDEIFSFKPHGIVGYTSPLFEVAQYILEKNIKVPSLGWIISAAEPLYESQREIIEQAFATKVFNTYGCREFTLIGAECSHQQGLHLNTDHLVVEVTDDFGQGTQGIGNMTITDLHNYGMPLIRFVNGDLGKLKQTSCSCDLPFPLLESVEGRKLDKIVTREGKIIPGEFFPRLFREMREVERYQVVQEHLDRIEINIVALPGLDSAAMEHSIQSAVKAVVGQELSVFFHYVDAIALTASGKHRVTISKLDVAS